MNASDVRGAARKVRDNPATGFLARLGYAASGVLHILLGIIAARIAWFRTGGSADQSGAFATLRNEPLGAVALAVLTVGFAGLAVWQVSTAVGAARGAGDRLKAAGKAVVYGALTWTGARFLLGRPSSSRGQSEDFTAKLMAEPGGRIAVGAVGVVVLVIALFHVYKGWSGRFRRDLARDPGRFVTAAGHVGYVAKGVALGVLGALFVTAATQDRPTRAGGLDAALRTLGQQPFGSVLLTVVAVGLVAYGVYCFGRARSTDT